MMKTWRMLALVVPIVLVTSCTDAAKAPAEAAMAAAATAVESLKGDAAKFAPDAVKSVEGSYATAKELIAKQDYKGALAVAQDIPAKAKEAIAKAAAAKDALVGAWNEAGGTDQDDGGRKEPNRHLGAVEEASGRNEQGDSRKGAD